MVALRVLAVEILSCSLIYLFLRRWVGVRRTAGVHIIGGSSVKIADRGQQLSIGQVTQSSSKVDCCGVGGRADRLD